MARAASSAQPSRASSRVTEVLRYDAIAGLAAAERLGIFGAFHPVPGDGTPEGTGTLLLLGPLEPGFWPHLCASAEWNDGGANPVDRWSRRVIGTMAAKLEGQPLFPFDGPPWHPFYAWALQSGRAWPSPVAFLVHDVAGLFVSYRGALALREKITLPQTPKLSPCATCAGQPCLSACPVGALGASGYDVPACHEFLDSAAGGDCLAQGCAVRRACPVSERYGRLAEQSAYHMSRFHPR